MRSASSVDAVRCAIADSQRRQRRSRCSSARTDDEPGATSASAGGVTVSLGGAAVVIGSKSAARRMTSAPDRSSRAATTVQSVDRLVKRPPRTIEVSDAVRQTSGALDGVDGEPGEVRGGVGGPGVDTEAASDAYGGTSGERLVGLLQRAGGRLGRGGVAAIKVGETRPPTIPIAGKGAIRKRQFLPSG